MFKAIPNGWRRIIAVAILSLAVAQAGCYLEIEGHRIDLDRKAREAYKAYISNPEEYRGREIECKGEILQVLLDFTYLFSTNSVPDKSFVLELVGEARSGPILRSKDQVWFKGFLDGVSTQWDIITILRDKHRNPIPRVKVYYIKVID
ncbi:MAG: hypothetical protein PHP20_00075 [Firmicutes bacterium]|nr:hypothetical protein [Bacillota bacterium]MDD4336895.1 hypothetical protein [Bacillota bacterium]MDD4791454.1 hypothetical protein [Bacillota bacterium]